MNEIPIYVTRARGEDGGTGVFTLSPWLFLLTCVVLWLNAVGWGLYGLYLLATMVVSHLG